ncbi:hypothetical protein ACFQ68_02830 [Amycolatopsis japonica]|uniref:hypothetical protein n=1 Tax=Amycolatopsis japonica TaxID=208439 RepID=UPI00366BDF0B
MRYDEPPPWSRRKEGWWSQYGRMVRFATAAAAFVLLPLVIMFFVDKDEALDRLRILAIGVGICSAVLFPAAWWYNRRDGADTLESLTKPRIDEGQNTQPSRHRR